MLPAAGGIDGGAAPDAGGAVEIKKGAATGAGAVFDHEVAVEQNGFDLREQRVVAVQIGPAGLRHADCRILEIGNGAAQKIGFGNKVGVEDGDKLAAGSLEAVFKSAGFESRAVGAKDVSDRQALRGVALDAGARDIAGFVGGVVEDLHVEQFVRVIETGDGFDEAFDDVAFVKNGKLNGDARPLRNGGRRAGNVLAIFIIIVNQPVTMKSVDRENDQNDEIRNHHHQVEGVDVVDAGESAVGGFVPIVGERVLGNERGDEKEIHGRR